MGWSRPEFGDPMASKVTVEDALLNVEGLRSGDIRPVEDEVERARGLIVNSGLSG